MTAGQYDDQDRRDLARLTTGDGGGLDALMERHAQVLFRYLLRLVKNQAEAEDLAQETFVRVYRHASRYDPKHKFSTWLYTIATNLVRDRQRHQARHPHVSLDSSPNGEEGPLGDWLPASGASPREAAEHAERAQRVQEAVASLPEDLRLPLVLAEYERLSQAEIGRILHCSAKAVEMRIYRARQRLREALADLLPSTT